MIDFALRKLSKGLPEKLVTWRYARAARKVGALSAWLAYGLPKDLEGAVESWKEWEEAYASRGFKPIAKGLLLQRGYHGQPNLDDLIGQRLEEGEEPVFYAPEYQQAIEKAEE